MEMNTSMSRISKINFFFIILLFNNLSFSQPVTGLSGWNIFIDPGHSEDENMGIYGYSEAKKNLRVGLNLQQMLTEWTDIDTAYICRTDDQQSVSLYDRTTHANNVGAAWYHSIHGNASSNPSTNNTLLLWGQYENNLEKIPNGGKAVSDLMIPLLTAGMRIPTIGSYGDHTFYGTCPLSRPCPYLYINYYTSMPSELSEAGFHTNPTQNQLNMNVNWKRLEAKTMFWTILEYKNIPRPFVGTVAGIIKDNESGLAVNGAVVTLDGQTCTTDTWESLFYLYSDDPNLLRNGFYYFENVSPGTHQLQITAEGFDNYTTDVTIVDAFFTFKDVSLISNVLLTVTSTDPAQNDSLYPGSNNITLNFSKPLNRTTFTSNIIITPDVSTDFAWSNSDKTVTINTTNFSFDTEYSITIKGNVEDIYGHLLDGNGDGTAGDDFVLNIKTKVVDVIAPVVVDVYPNADDTDVELKPIISVAFDELLNTSTIASGIKIIRNSTQSDIGYTLYRQYAVNGRTVVNYFIRTPLVENESYTIKLLTSLQDVFGNSLQNEIDFEFTTGNSDYFTQTIIDDFDGGILSWWQPALSDSTVGIILPLTNISSVSSIYNLSTIANTKSMMFNYGYDESSLNWLIKLFRSETLPSFDNSSILQTYIFGDGNNNKFRFCLRETDGTSPTNLEVSRWYDINWIGWKLVNWDLSLGQTGTWLGNEILEPPFVFDSFQFKYVLGNENTGTYYLDDLRTATFSPTDVVQANDRVPNNFALEQNYPNPFNPNTVISWQSPIGCWQSLKIYDLIGNEVTTLVDEYKQAGNYQVEFRVGQDNSPNIASGVYFYQLRAGEFISTKKFVLLK